MKNDDLEQIMKLIRVMNEWRLCFCDTAALQFLLTKTKISTLKMPTKQNQEDNIAILLYTWTYENLEKYKKKCQRNDTFIIPIARLT